ncbi:MAG: enoyl-CoA hydratase/isomerase family protein, partial [Dehalococcoidia bacterium]
MPNDALTHDGSIATLTLAQPLDADCVAALTQACEQVAQEDATRVLVLQAPAAWAGWTDGAWAQAEELGLIGDPFAAFARLPQPTIAVLQGPVRDAGLELALCGDIRVAAADATFALPGLGAGAMPIAGGLQRLARAVGRARAHELALGGATIDAE